MDEKPDEIIDKIESQKQRLGRNLHELESKVRRTADWRAQFERNPALMLGAAVGGGLLLGTMLTSGRKVSKASWSSSPRNTYAGTSPGTSTSSSFALGAPSTGSPTGHRGKTTDTLEHMKNALIAFATTKAKEFMCEALPGFRGHLDEAEQRQYRYQTPSPTMRTEYSAQTPYPQEPVVSPM